MIVWTKEFDRTILIGVKAGRSASEIAIDLGPTFTRNMVIGRHKRLRKIVSPCEQRAKDEARARANRKKQDRANFVARHISVFEQRISRGTSRNRAIALARYAGLSFREIGKHVGISHERARQICLELEAFGPAAAA